MGVRRIFQSIPYGNENWSNHLWYSCNNTSHLLWLLWRPGKNGITVKNDPKNHKIWPKNFERHLFKFPYLDRPLLSIGISTAYELFVRIVEHPHLRNKFWFIQNFRQQWQIWCNFSSFGHVEIVNQLEFKNYFALRDDMPVMKEKCYVWVSN